MVIIKPLILLFKERKGRRKLRKNLSLRSTKSVLPYLKHIDEYDCNCNYSLSSIFSLQEKERKEREKAARELEEQRRAVCLLIFFLARTLDVYFYPSCFMFFFSFYCLVLFTCCRYIFILEFLESRRKRDWSKNVNKQRKQFSKGKMHTWVKFSLLLVQHILF